MGERADPMRNRGDFDDVRTSDSFDSFDSGDRDEPAVIAEEIEQTRANMTGTIEAIQERLAPERITDQAKDAALDVTEQARTAALEVAEYAIQEVKTAVRELADHLASEQVAGQAKGAAIEVTEHAIQGAKAAVREMGDQAKGAVREATVGRVERMVSSTGESAKGLRANVASTI